MISYPCCMDCKRRRVGCHSGCEDYAKQRILNSVIAHRSYVQRKARSIADDFVRDAIRRNGTRRI